MVADLSHRLRTPLTALRLDAEALDPDDTQIISLTDDEIDRRRGIRRIRQAIVTLEDEVNQLINTTRQAVAAQVAAAPETGVCDASEVVRERMTFWSALAGDQDRQYRVVGAQMRIPVPVARAELAAALDAILGNVFRYTPQGTAFEVGISRRGRLGSRCVSTTPAPAFPIRRKQCNVARATRVPPGSGSTSPAGRPSPRAARSASTGRPWAARAWSCCSADADADAQTGQPFRSGRAPGPGAWQPPGPVRVKRAMFLLSSLLKAFRSWAGAGSVRPDPFRPAVSSPAVNRHRAPARQGEVLSAHRRPAPRGHRRAVSGRPHRLLPVALGLALLGVGRSGRAERGRHRHRRHRLAEPVAHLTAGRQAGRGPGLRRSQAGQGGHALRGFVRVGQADLHARPPTRRRPASTCAATSPR